MLPYCNISNPRHLFDLLHSSFADVPTEMIRDVRYTQQAQDHSVMELKLAGIKFKPRMSAKVLDISFTNKVLEVRSISSQVVRGHERVCKGAMVLAADENEMANCLVYRCYWCSRSSKPRLR